MVTFPYNTTDFAFTLEKLFINFSTENNSYFTLEIVIKYYEFYSDVEKTKTLDYKIPVFNGAAQFYVGNIIHRNLSNLQTTFAAGFQVNTCLVSFTAKEIAIADDTIVATNTLEDVNFIPGNKPKRLADNIALLDANIGYCRITPSGTYQTNFLLKSGSHILKVYKNTTEVDSLEITATSLKSLYSFVFEAKTYNAKQGDVFKVAIAGTTIFKEIGVIPPTTYSHTFFYKNFNKLLSSLEFTGEYSFPEKFDQIKQESLKNANKVLEIIETTEEKSLKINTGWVLKDQIVLINQLLKSNYVLVKNIEALSLEMVPIAKKRTGLDSKQELFSYALEFRINKEKDA